VNPGALVTGTGEAALVLDLPGPAAELVISGAVGLLQADESRSVAHVSG
jgi:hypothetical protein